LKISNAKWLNEAVATDQGLITPKSPNDLDDFNMKIVQKFRKEKHFRQTT